MTRNTKVLMGFAVTITILIIFSISTYIIKDKDVIRVGSKNFTEQVILGEIVSQLIENNLDIPVERKLNLGGTFICFNALRNGELDLYIEYTGTGLTAILKRETLSDADEVYRIVKKTFLENFNLVWLNPIGFNNTYTLTMRREHAQRLGVKRISDLKTHADKLLPGFDHEFLERPDGYKGLKVHYGFQFSREPREMDPGLMYKAITDKSVDIIDGFSTDGRIPAFDLVILKDDKSFFPPYQAAPLVRAETLVKHPVLHELLNWLWERISNETMQGLNYEVDEKGKMTSSVAREFLERTNAPRLNNPAF